MKLKLILIILSIIVSINCEITDSEFNELVKKFLTLGKPSFEKLDCANRTNPSNEQLLKDFFTKCRQYYNEHAFEPLTDFCKKHNSSNLLNSISKYDDITPEFENSFKKKANQFIVDVDDLKKRMYLFVELDSVIDKIDKNDTNQLYKAVSVTVKNIIPIGFLNNLKFNKTTTENEIIYTEFQNCDLDIDLYSAVLTLNLKRIVFKFDENTKKLVLDQEAEPIDPMEYRFEDCPTEELDEEQFEAMRKPTLNYFCFYKKIFDVRSDIFAKFNIQ